MPSGLDHERIRFADDRDLLADGSWYDLDITVRVDEQLLELFDQYPPAAATGRDGVAATAPSAGRGRDEGPLHRDFAVEP